MKMYRLPRGSAIKADNSIVACVEFTGVEAIIFNLNSSVSSTRKLINNAFNEVLLVKIYVSLL